MKTLIIKALDRAWVQLEKQVPLTKKEIKNIIITNISPLDIPSFMKENNIPENAYFNANNIEMFTNDIVLEWDIDVPTTDEDKLKYKRKRFTSIAWYIVYNILTENGYKRKGFNSGLLKEFDDTTVYDMYQNKQFDRLVKYYSLSFAKPF